MSLASLLTHIWQHPLNRKSSRTAAVGRFVRWQIASRVMPSRVALPFVNDSYLVTTRGMTGATGNWYCGLHESGDMGFALHLLRPGDLFVDVGANVGSYTVLAAAGVGADVISIEPLPSTFAQLRQNIAFNDIGDRVTALCMGVSDKPDRLRFSADHGPMNHVLAEGEAGRAIEVPVTPLDEICAGRSPLLLKIDVEGHELAVLRGAKATLSSGSVLAVIMETNGLSGRFDVDQQDVFVTMAGHGFTPYRYDAVERTLRQAEGADNTIFIRDVERVAAICRGAATYRLCNTDI